MTEHLTVKCTQQNKDTSVNPCSALKATLLLRVTRSKMILHFSSSISSHLKSVFSLRHTAVYRSASCKHKNSITLVIKRHGFLIYLRGISTANRRWLLAGGQRSDRGGAECQEERGAVCLTNFFSMCHPQEDHELWALMYRKPLAAPAAPTAPPPMLKGCVQHEGESTSRPSLLSEWGGEGDIGAAGDTPSGQPRRTTYWGS